MTLAPADDEPSRSARKRASEALQELGETLLELGPEVFAPLPLPDALQDALHEGTRISGRAGLRRHKQYIGKLMRDLDDDVVALVRNAVNHQRQQAAVAAGQLHEIEAWRDGLIADDDRLTAWLRAFPGGDSRRLRALIRAARQEALAAPADGPQRRGPAYRQLFGLLRDQLAAGPSAAAPGHTDP